MSTVETTTEGDVEFLQRLGAINVRVDGSSVLGTFTKAASDGRDANVRIHETADPKPYPVPTGDGRVTYRFGRLGTWSGYVDVVADR